MRFWYDCEFIEDSKTIDLISIGIVAEDGRELYLQSVEFDPEKASPWVWEHVMPHLAICKYPQGIAPEREIQAQIARELRIHRQFPWQDTPERQHCCWRTRAQIKREILSFMDIATYGKPELWGYYSAYDHVAFCQLFGMMMDLPEGFPMYTRDIKQLCDSLGNPQLPEQTEGEHNALCDARHNRVMYEFLAKRQDAQSWQDSWR